MHRSPLAFITLVFALSLPFWLAGALTDLELLPGLPVSALMLVCPGIAAAILVHHETGAHGIRELVKRPVDLHRIERKVWYVPTFLLFPVVMLASYWILVAMGIQLPRWDMPVVTVLGLALVSFVSAAAEEIGRMGCAWRWSSRSCRGRERSAVGVLFRLP